MSEHSINLERLAALMDGRLDETARLLVMEELTRSNEDLELLGMTAELLNDLEREDRQSPFPLPLHLQSAIDAPADGAHLETVPDSEVQRSGREVSSNSKVSTNRLARRVRGMWASVGIAAVVAVTAGLALRFNLSRDQVKEPRDLAAMLDVPPTRRFAPAMEWSSTRGAAIRLDPHARAIRFGANVMQIELALRAADTAQVRDLSGRMEILLLGQLGSGPAMSLYRRVATKTATAPDSIQAWLTSGWRFASAAVGEDDAWLGAWLAAARVAGELRQDAFITPHTSASVERALERLTSSDDIATHSAALRVRAALSREGAIQWDQFIADVVQLLNETGR